MNLSSGPLAHFFPISHGQKHPKTGVRRCPWHLEPTNRPRSWFVTESGDRAEKQCLLRGCNAAISVAVEKFQALTSTSHPLQSLQILLNWPWSQPLYHWVLGQGEEILCTKIKDQRCMKCECYQGYLLNQEASVSIHSQRQLMLFLWVQEARWFSGLQVTYCRLSCWKAAQWHTTHSLNLDNLPEVTDYILRSILHSWHSMQTWT